MAAVSFTSPSSPQVGNNISVTSTAAEPSSLSTQPERSKRRSEGKSVKFHTSVKRHDGLCELSQIYFDSILNVYGLSKKPVVRILAHNHNLRGLIYVQKKFGDLIRRCLSSKKGRAPVLEGGGCGSMFVDRTHLDFLYAQMVYQDKLISKVSTNIARRRRAHLQLNRTKQEQESK